MASSTATVREKQISIESQSSNSKRRENVKKDVLFSLNIPISIIWSWKSHDLDCLVSVVNKSITRLGVNLDQSCTVLRNRFKKKVHSVLVKILLDKSKVVRIMKTMLKTDLCYLILKKIKLSVCLS